MFTNETPRRILLDLAVTLDGFIEGENGEIDWCIMDPEMNFIDFLNSIDSIIYGRKSYELWGKFTLDQMETDDDKEMWQMIHQKQKYVFSRTQKSSDDHVIFINDNIAEEVNRLKNMPGQDIWLYGGSSLITSFIDLGLIDEFRLSVHPVILGEGKPLFCDIKQRLNLKLIETKSYRSGVVQLIYHRDPK